MIPILIITLVLIIFYCFFIIIKLSKSDNQIEIAINNYLKNRLRDGGFITNQELARYLFDEDDLVRRTNEAKEIKSVMFKNGYKQTRLRRKGKRYGGYIK